MHYLSYKPTFFVVVILSAALYLQQGNSSLFPARPVAGQGTKPVTLQGAAALDQLKQAGQYESLQAVVRQAHFSVSRAENTPLGRAAWHAPNPAAGYDAYVTETGVSIALNDESYLSLSLHSLGYGVALQAVGPGEVSGDQQTISLRREGGVREWYVNGPDGLEHGFTLSEPPGARQQGMHLRLALEVSAGWRAVASEDGKRVTLRGADGQAVEYGKLVVRDNLGRNIKARLTVADEKVVIEAEDHDAAYPLTIDPLFTLQQRLTATDGAVGDHLGYAVALAGDTALVGALYDEVTETDQGSAYVFVRNGATWTQQARLFAQDGASNDFFGSAVALDGDTALVGAPGDNTGKGSAYVFVRDGTTWTQQAKLAASDGTAGAQFGAALGLDGQTALIGARAQEAPPPRTDVTGAAYVFVRSGTTWTQQARLLANDAEDNDSFGVAVALDADTALIGAPNNAVTVGGQGVAYVFTRNGASWAQQQRLIRNNSLADEHFGNAVALSGKTALIGAYLYGSDDSGAVFSFNRGATGWTQIDTFFAPHPTAGAHFGVSLALDGDTAVVGASLGLPTLGVDQRSAYVFVNLGDWELVRHLGPELGAANDRFGYAVALDGDTVLIGAYLSKVSAAAQGAAYAFVLHDSRHVEQQKLLAHDGVADDLFGDAVALDGDTLVVGAVGDSIGANAEQGSVYVFTRNGTAWTLQQKLTANDGAAGDNFGGAVALDGDTLVVGAYRDAIGGNANQGSAYVFTRSGATWAQQAKLIANDGAAGDRFGWEVALSGDTAVVGALQDQVGNNLYQGSAYVFTRNGVLWGARQKLTANDGASYDNFSYAVALSGDTLAVGAIGVTIGANANQGSVYVFTRNGTTWTFQQKLTASDGRADDYFGYAVALNGDTLAAGAAQSAIDGNDRQGSAYVFTRNGAMWTPQQKLTASDGAAGDYFGSAVTLSGDTLVVGALYDTIGTSRRQGSVYVFTRVGNWVQQQKLTAGDGAEGDHFGSEVALSGDTIVVGAPNDYIGTNIRQGSVYVFVSPPCPALAIAPDSLPNGVLGAAYNQQLTASGGSGVDEQFYFAVSNGALPPGLTLDYSGRLQGTPTAAGTYHFTITTTVALSRCPGSREYTLTVTPPCPPLTVEPETLPDGTTGAAYGQTLTATGGAAPYSFAVATGALPQGLSLSNAGVLSGAPTMAGAFPFTLRVSDANGCAETRAYALMIKAAALACVSAASYKAGAAPESIVAAFGAQLSTQTQAASGLPLPTEMAGVRASLRDSLGVERPAPLFFVSPGQINFQIPAGTASGTATLSLSGGAAGQVEIASTAPGLFAANADGQGVPAAVLLRVRADGSQSYEPVARLEGNRFVPAPLDLGPAGEQVYLVLFGTGIRFQQTVRASLGGLDANVLFAGAVAGFAGLDQINLLLPRALAGRGEVDVNVIVGGVAANSLRVAIQ